MSPEVRKARKKPVEISYMVWPGEARNATPVIQWILDGGGAASYHEERFVGTTMIAGKVEDYTRPECITIQTLEGRMVASAGDVIIQGVNGEFYPCKPDIFKKTYDPITEEN